MNKTTLALIITLLTLTNALADGQFDYVEKKIIKKTNSIDIKKYDKIADTLINEFLSKNNINPKDLPTSMENELLSKKNILIQKLASLDTTKKVDTNNPDIINTINSLFDSFVQRVEYAKISAMNKNILNAIKEAKKTEQSNSSYPNIDKNKQYLLTQKK